MITTLIIGKSSNLSQRLSEQMDKSVLISSREINDSLAILEPYIKKPINIIFNNFQPAVALGDVDAPVDYISNSILVTAKLLDFFKHAVVNKIIYTSSSAVYGNNTCCKESDQVMPCGLHAALKYANEQLVQQFCQKNSIDYTITRVFNMYGGDDKFSIVSKMLEAFKQYQSLTIFNGGMAIRDFIHIDDVVLIYLKLLKIKDINLVNVAAGKGIQIKDLLNFINGSSQILKANNIERAELSQSIADITLLESRIGVFQYTNVLDFLSREMYA